MKKKVLLISVGIVVVLAAGGAGAYFSGALAPTDESAQDSVTVDSRPFLYVELKPLVLTFVQKKKTRYLQVSTQVVSRDEATVAAINANAPMLQAAALKQATIIGAEQLRTNEGRDRLLAAMRDEIPKLRVFENLSPPLDIEDVILTGILEQ